LHALRNFIEILSVISDILHIMHSFMRYVQTVLRTITLI